MATPLARFHSVPVFLLAVSSPVLACGARSTLLEESEDGTPAADATGGAAGSIVFATGGQGGQVMGGTGGTSHPPTGGAAGAPQTTAATGGVAGASGGAGGGFLGGCQYPSCIWYLIRDCHPTGQCVRDNSAASGLPAVVKLCCDDGFGEHVTVEETGSTIHGSLAVTKNGRKCYDVSFRAAMQGDGTFLVRYVWTAPTAEAVATGTLEDDGSLLIVCSGGETMTMSYDCSPDGVSNDPPPADGTCE